MLRSIEYATLLQYSPNGGSEVSKLSRRWRDAVKGARLEQIRTRVAGALADHATELAPFLHEGASLVPIPRSSPIREGDLWPSLEIANLLASLNLGTVAICLTRTAPVRKSAYQSTAQGRPSIEEHYRSFEATGLVPSNTITLVDDILTQGRTAVAAASRVAERFPGATVRLFCVLRAKGLDKEIDEILHLVVDAISFNPKTGKCSVKA